MPSPPSFNPGFYENFERRMDRKYDILAQEAEGAYQRNTAEAYRLREMGGQVAPDSAAQRELQKAEAYLRKQMGISEESVRNLTPEGADMLHRLRYPEYYRHGQGAQPGAGAVQPDMFSPTPLNQQTQQPSQYLTDPGMQQPYVAPKIPVPGEEPVYHGPAAQPYGGPSQVGPQSLIPSVRGQDLSVGQQIARRPIQTQSLLRPSTFQQPNMFSSTSLPSLGALDSLPGSTRQRLKQQTLSGEEQPYRKGTSNVVPLRKGSANVKGKGGGSKSSKSGGEPKGLEAILPALMAAAQGGDQMGGGVPSGTGPQAADSLPPPMAPGAAARPGFARGMPNVMHYQEGSSDTSSSVAPSGGGTSGGGNISSSVAPSGGGTSGGVGGTGGGDTHIYMPGAVHAPTSGPVSAAHTPLPQFGPQSGLDSGLTPGGLPPAGAGMGALPNNLTQMYSTPTPFIEPGVQVAGKYNRDAASVPLPPSRSPDYELPYTPIGGGPSRIPGVGPVQPAGQPSMAPLGDSQSDPGRVPTGYFAAHPGGTPGLSVTQRYGADVRDSDGWPSGIPRGGQFANVPGLPGRDFSEPVRVGRTGHVAGVGRPGSAPVYDVGGHTYDVGRNGLPLAQQGQPGFFGPQQGQPGWTGTNARGVVGPGGAAATGTASDIHPGWAWQPGIAGRGIASAPPPPDLNTPEANATRQFPWASQGAQRARGAPGGPRPIAPGGPRPIAPGGPSGIPASGGGPGSTPLMSIPRDLQPLSRPSGVDWRNTDFIENAKGNADVKTPSGKGNGKGKSKGKGASNDLPKGLAALLPMLMAAAQGGGGGAGAGPQAPMGGPPQAPGPRGFAMGTPSAQPNPNYPFGAGYLFGATAVPGQGSGTVDTVPAMLAPHEAVLNRAAADMLGRGLISALNNAGTRRMGMR